MAWQQILPVQDRSIGAQTPGYPSGIAWPAGATLLEGRIDCTTGVPATPFQGIAHPFNDPAMHIDWLVEVSYDNQATWLRACGGTEDGAVAGVWGKQMFPYCAVGPFSTDPARTNLPPTHYRASIAPHQLTTYGISLQVS